MENRSVPVFAMDEIRTALAAGKEVTTHTDAISVPGWSGAGYIIMDPETGIGAYKIGGGLMEGLRRSSYSLGSSCSPRY